MSGTGFSNYKAYIVETSSSNSYTNSYCFNLVFRNYTSFNITVNTGINFRQSWRQIMTKVQIEVISSNAENFSTIVYVCDKEKIKIVRQN